MPEIDYLDHQLRSILIKCSARLKDIRRRSAAVAPGSTSIIPACHAELHEVIVHAVISIKPAVPNAAHYRSMISRTYATGLDAQSGAPTVESIRAITTLIDAAAGAIGGLTETRT
ncbi:MAG TPA: hypothetical protein VGC21_02750 [Telluria sp.]|jgi:hypothetical protein